MAGKPSLPLWRSIVGDKTLQVADGNRLALLAERASAFALFLLRANAPGDGGQRVIFAHLGRRGQKIARVDQLHDLSDLDADGTIDLAAGFGAGDATRGFLDYSADPTVPD